jgi:hypothetical protein
LNFGETDQAIRAGGTTWREKPIDLDAPVPGHLSGSRSVQSSRWPESSQHL